MRVRRNYQEKVCLDCGKKFKPTTSNQRYCGGIKEKKGCSFQRRKLYEKRYKRTPIGMKIAMDYRRRTRFAKEGKRLKFRFQIFQKDNFTCQYCGRKAPNVELQIDHKYPKSKGGKDEIENYITACSECNLGKGDIILKEIL